MRAFLLGILIVVATPAVAGTIQGKVTAKSELDVAGSNVVVWIENAPASPVPAGTPVLSQKEVRFSPSFMVVVAGQTVQMPNDDDLAHNVFSRSPARAFDLGFYPKGESRSVTFTNPGLVDLFCRIHRHMNAKIFVVPNPHYDLTHPGDRYEIKNLPAGTYQVTTWHEHLAKVKRNVKVPANGSVTVDFLLTDSE